MDEFEMKRRIYGYIKEICHYSQMQVFATSYYQKNYFQMQIDDATSALISMYMDIWRMPEHRGENRRYRNQGLRDQTVQQDEQIPVQTIPPQPISEQPISPISQAVPQPEPQMPLPSQPVPQPEPQIPLPSQPVPQPEPQIPLPSQPVPQTEQQIPLPSQPVPQPEPQIPLPSQPIPQPEAQMPLPEQQVPQQELRTFTIEELAQFNGKNGQPAYVAVNGTVYDVSALARWAGGNHFGMVAGRDLSGPFMGCHQGITDRLKKAVIVGTLEKGV